MRKRPGDRGGSRSRRRHPNPHAGDAAFGLGPQGGPFDRGAGRRDGEKENGHVREGHRLASATKSGIRRRKAMWLFRDSSRWPAVAELAASSSCSVSPSRESTVAILCAGAAVPRQHRVLYHAAQQRRLRPSPRLSVDHGVDRAVGVLDKAGAIRVDVCSYGTTCGTRSGGDDSSEYEHEQSAATQVGSYLGSRPSLCRRSAPAPSPIRPRPPMIHLATGSTVVKEHRGG